MKIFLTLALLFLVPQFLNAEIHISRSQRVMNDENGVCAWASLEMLAKYHGIREVEGITDWQRENSGGNGATVHELSDFLTERGVRHEKYTGYRKGNAVWMDWSALDWAKSDKGLLIGVKNWPYSGVYHAILVTHWDGKTLKFVDPNDAWGVWTIQAGQQWLEDHWIGYAIALYPPGEPSMQYFFDQAVLLASETLTEPSWINLSMQGGALVILAYLAYWASIQLPKVFIEMLDRQDKLVSAFREELRLERDACERRHEEVVAELQSLKSEILSR